MQLNRLKEAEHSTGLIYRLPRKQRRSGRAGLEREAGRAPPETGEVVSSEGLKRGCPAAWKDPLTHFPTQFRPRALGPHRGPGGLESTEQRRSFS